MRTRQMNILAVLVSAVIALGATPAGAEPVTVSHLVRILGMESTPLTGLGLVIGLDGTGDTSKDSYAAIRPLAEYYKSLGNPVTTLEELQGSDAVAVVAVEMRVPKEGAHAGDSFDVSVSKLYNAQSLEGGRLVGCLLRLPGRNDADAIVWAEANGPLEVLPDTPASGVVRGGGRMLRPMLNDHVVNDAGYMWLAIHPPFSSWSVANMIAESINDPEDIDAGFGQTSYRRLARVKDPRTIRIEVPEGDREDPSGFIQGIMSITIDSSLIDAPARIVIDARNEVITVSGDVQLDPVAIAHNGFSINTLDGGAGEASPWITLDPSNGESRRAPMLSDLMQAFQLMRVPVRDQIAIIEALAETGKLYADIKRS